MNLRYDNDQHREEGGFQTRPYESHSFFAFFAFFAVNSLVLFGCGFAALGLRSEVVVRRRRCAA